MGEFSFYVFGHQQSLKEGLVYSNYLTNIMDWYAVQQIKNVCASVLVSEVIVFYYLLLNTN